MKVKVSNVDLSGEERTYLSDDYSSGTTLTVGNNEGFAANDHVIVGEPGQEKTEEVAVDSVSGNTSIIISAALKFAHAKSTPVYYSQYDQISFERKPTGGSFAEIGISPFDMEWDNADKKTLVVVAGGLSTDTYRWRFYDSVGENYSEYSGELAGTGLARTQVGFLFEQVRRNPVAQGVDDEALLDFFNDFQELVYEEIPKGWWFRKTGTAVSTEANDYTYPISTNWSDFLSMDKMLYNYISGDVDITYPLTWATRAEMRTFKADSNQADDDTAHWWSLYPPDSDSARGYIVLHPTPETADCYLQPVYWFELTALDSFDDTIVVPKPKGYVDYGLYRIFDDIKNDDANARKFNARVARDIIALRKRKRRQSGQQVLTRFRGQRGWSKLFGETKPSADARELYW